MVCIILYIPSAKCNAREYKQRRAVINIQLWRKLCSKHSYTAGIIKIYQQAACTCMNNLNTYNSIYSIEGQLDADRQIDRYKHIIQLYTNDLAMEIMYKWKFSRYQQNVISHYSFHVKMCSFYYHPLKYFLISVVGHVSV